MSKFSTDLAVVGEKMDIKVEDGVIATNSDPSKEISLNLTSAVMKVKTEFIPEAEDEIDDASDTSNFFEITKNESNEIKIEQTDDWSEDVASKCEHTNFDANVSSSEKCVAIFLKEEAVEDEEKLAQASVDGYAAVSFEDQADVESDDKLCQTVDRKKNDENYGDEFDMKTSVFPCNSEAADCVAQSFSCPRCFVEFRTSSAIECHLRICDGEQLSVNVKNISAAPKVPTVPTFSNVQQRRAVVNSNEKRFSCTRCFVELRTSSAMECHLRICIGEQLSTNVKNIPIVPKVPTVPTISTVSNAQRRRAVVNSNEKRFSCTRCFVELKTSSAMEYHLRICIGEQLSSNVENGPTIPIIPTISTIPTIPIVCNIPIVRNIRRPRSVAKSNEKQFSCNHCRAAFKTKSALKQHSVVHSQDRPFSCPKCPATFKTVSHANVHLTVHLKDKPVSCTLCPAAFRNKYEARRHAIVHLNEKPFVCPLCPQAFKRKSYFKEHLALHSEEKPFSCANCPATFKTKRALKDHLTIHAKVQPFMCDVCHVSFTTKKSLNRHASVHSKERPFLCADCPATFKHKYDLQAHSKTHSSGEPLSCGHCNGIFTTKSHLKHHLVLHLKKRSFETKLEAEVQKMPDPAMQDSEKTEEIFGI